MVFAGHTPIGSAAEHIIVALDVDHPSKAIDIVRRLVKYGCGFKIGRELIDSTFAILASPDGDPFSKVETVEDLQELFKLLDAQEFLDVKLHDISNTVAGAMKGFALLKARIINVDGSAVSMKMLKAAVAAKGESLIFAPTVLTDMDADDCDEIFDTPAVEMVEIFAERLVRAGFDGIICSPQELPRLKEEGYLDKLIAMTPGIRPLWAVANDQARPTTPGDAIRAGATYLVIGRPITAPPEEIGSSERALELIIEEIEEALRAA